MTLKVHPLRHFLLHSHERAIRQLLPALPQIKRITIVGGGIFPRTALIFQRILPKSEITIVDADSRNIQTAKGFLNGSVRYVHEFFHEQTAIDSDLLVIPLSFRGNRRHIYANPPAETVLIHDWIWRQHRSSAIVSWLLLKRINLVCRRR